MIRQQSDRFHKFNLLNMVLGTLAFVIAVYLMATGGYDNLLLGKFEIGAPLYVVLFWYLDRYFRPLWFSGSVQAR